MMHIFTVFNKNEPYQPLCTIIKDKHGLEYIDLYAKGTKRPLKKVKGDMERIRNKISTSITPVIINDFKAHVHAFDLPPKLFYNVYDPAFKGGKAAPDRESAMAAVKDDFRSFRKIEPMKWMWLRANAGLVYAALEKRGIWIAFKQFYPQYHQRIKTGRSSTTGFNIQSDKEHDIKIDESFKVFLHFDWVSADFRILSWLSQDENMLEAFRTSDPYTFMDPENRKECKRMLLAATNSLRLDSDALQFFPQLREWMVKTIDQIDNKGYVETIMGRRFHITSGDDQDRRSIFNSVAQGSVVHAMHAALIKVFEKYGHYLLTELHDSIVLNSDRPMAGDIIKDVGRIMVRPLDGYIEEEIFFPTQLSIGKAWKQWELAKEMRSA